MLQSSTSFVNQNWTSNGSFDMLNEYTSIGMEVTIYQSSDYAIYESFLDASEASNMIDADTDYLTSSYLNSFKAQVNSYDDYAIRVKLTVDESLSVNNQAIGFCMAEEDRGVQCGTASTGSSGTSAEEFRTYWFPISIISQIKDDTPLDPWDSANDEYMIDDYYYGLTQYYMRMASSTILVSDKFQFKEVSDEVQWNNVDDYRFK